MSICTRCGKLSPDNSANCVHCGAPFGHRLRAKENEKKIRSGQLIRFGIFLVIAIILAIVGPSLYHTVGTAYLKHNLEQMTAETTAACGGPVTASTEVNQRAEIEGCIAKNPDLKRSRQLYENFTKGDK